MKINIQSKSSWAAFLFVCIMAIFGIFQSSKFVAQVFRTKKPEITMMYQNYHYEETGKDLELRRQIAEQLNKYISTGLPTRQGLEKKFLNYQPTYCYEEIKPYEVDYSKPFCEIRKEEIVLDDSGKSKIRVPLIYNGDPLSVLVDPEIKNYPEVLALKIMIAIGWIDKEEFKEYFGYRKIVDYLD